MTNTQTTPPDATKLDQPDALETVTQDAPKKSGSTGSALVKLLKIGLPVAIASSLFYGVWLSYQPVPDQLQGMVDAREVRAASKITGRIEEFLVDEGEFVTEGQVLFIVDSPEVEARERQAQGALAAAEATEAKALSGARSEDVRAARAQWQRAVAAADLADVTFERLSRLHNEGVVPGQTRDEAEANALAAREQERAAKAVYDEALAGARTEDIAAATGQVERARGALAEVDAASQETRIVAPVSGEVGKRNIQRGEIAPQGYPVFVITETRDPWVTVFVREDQYADIAMGRTYSGRVPALGDKVAEFEVTFIEPAGDFATWRATRQSSGFDIRSFEIWLEPVEPVEGLRPGMSVLFDWPQN